MAQAIEPKTQLNVSVFAKTLFVLLVGSCLLGFYANDLINFSKHLGIFLFLIALGLSYGLIHIQIYDRYPMAWIITSGAILLQMVICLTMILIRTSILV